MSFEEAVEIFLKCDGTKADCDTCPLDKDLKWDTDRGVFLQTTMCNILELARNILDEGIECQRKD